MNKQCIKCWGFILFAAAQAFAQDVTALRDPIATPAVDDLPQAVRTARDNMFAFLARTLPPFLTEVPGTPPRVTSITRPSYPELPVANVNAILMGTITKLTPRELPAGRGLYTEFRVAVDNILKFPGDSISKNGIDLVEIGGAAILPNGKVVRHLSKGLGTQLELGRRYLMFLNYEPSGQCFRVFKVWELRNGQAVATANDDLKRVATGTSQYNAASESATVNAVANLIGR